MLGGVGFFRLRVALIPSSGCSKCGGDRADAWCDRHMEKLLPVPYFLVTFTLPHTLNAVARSNQTLI